MFRSLRDNKPASKEDPKPGLPQPAGLANPAPPAESRQATVRYVDREDCEETFADSIQNIFFDGQTLRIEFAITRFDEIKPNVPVTGRRYPACRLVLTPATAVDLMNKMQQIVTGMTQAGLVKPAQKPPAKAT